MFLISAHVSPSHINTKTKKHTLSYNFLPIFPSSSSSSSYLVIYLSVCVCVCVCVYEYVNFPYFYFFYFFIFFRFSPLPLFLLYLRYLFVILMILHIVALPICLYIVFDSYLIEKIFYYGRRQGQYKTSLHPMSIISNYRLQLFHRSFKILCFFQLFAFITSHIFSPKNLVCKWTVKLERKKKK